MPHPFQENGVEPTSIPTSDPEKFVTTCVNTPLVLDGLVFQKEQEQKRKSDITPLLHTSEVHLGDRFEFESICNFTLRTSEDGFLESVCDFTLKTTDDVVDSPHSYVGTMIKSLQKKVLDSVVELVAKHYDLFQSPQDAHRIVVERTQILLRLKKDITDSVVFSYGVGSKVGGKKGTRIMREILGSTKPSKVRGYSFNTMEEHNMAGRVSWSSLNRKVPICLEVTAQRETEGLKRRLKQANLWLVEMGEVAIDMVEYKIRDVLGCPKPYENTHLAQVAILHPGHEMDIKYCIKEAMEALFDAGMYSGYHVAQERMKYEHGISDKWTYFHSNPEFDDAIVISKVVVAVLDLHLLRRPVHLLQSTQGQCFYMPDILLGLGLQCS